MDGIITLDLHFSHLIFMPEPKPMLFKLETGLSDKNLPTICVFFIIIAIMLDQKAIIHILHLCL